MYTFAENISTKTSYLATTATTRHDTSEWTSKHMLHTFSNRLLFRSAQQKKRRRRVRAWIEKEQTLLAGEGWGKERKVHPVRERTAFDKMFGPNCRRFLSSPAPPPLSSPPPHSTPFVK